MASYDVTDAGTPAVNGAYIESGTFGGRPAYTNGAVILWWNDPVQWAFSDVVGQLPGYYFNNVTGDPDDATGWWMTGMLGTDPHPTVTLHTDGGGDPPVEDEPAFIPQVLFY